MSISFPRRTFLRSTAAASSAALIGAAALGNPKTASAGQFTGRIKKAVKYHMVTEKISITDKFKLLKDLGYDGVEIRIADKVDPKEALKARDATGLPIHGVINSSSPDIKTAVDRAKLFGGDTVLVVAGRVDAKTSYDVNYKERQALYRKWLPYAEKQKIRLLVENVWNNFLLSPLEMARFLDELESPWIGAYFDVGNVVRFGWPDQWIRILGDRIGKLDIKEYSRKIQLNEGLRKGFNVEIGDGDCDWPAVRKALAEIKYSGWATAEVKGGDRKRLAEIAERMDKALDL